jgi:hypothetical protein
VSGPVAPGPRVHPAAALRRARLRRRAWWLVGTLPVVLALVVLGVRLTAMVPLATFAKGDYDDGEHADAAGTYGSLRTLNLVEPWKAHFDTGTAQAAAGDVWNLAEAVRSLDEAYALAADEPPEVRCMVQTNLALAHELSGDDEMAFAERRTAELEAVLEATAARDAGLPYDEDVLDPFRDGVEPDPDELRQTAQDWYAYAERSYATAEQVRAWPDCGESEQTPEQQETAEAAEQRLQDKQQQARDAQEAQGGDAEGDGSEGSDGDEQSDASGGEGAEGDQQSEAERQEQERRQRLQEQNSEASEEADREEQEYRDLYGDEPGGSDGGDGSDGTTKNW